MIRNSLIFFTFPIIAYIAYQQFGAPFREAGSYLNTKPAQRYRFAPPIEQSDETIFPIAWYQLDALVVAAKEYDDTLSPIDLGVVWGPILNKDPLNELNFSQKERFLYFRGSKQLLSKEALRCIANVHVIPANETIRSQVMSLGRGDYVSLKGSLVQVFGRSGIWNSSLSRNDTGAGACEVFYVTDARRFDPNEPSKNLRPTITQPRQSNSAATLIMPPDFSNFAVVESPFPKEMVVTRQLEISVDTGTMLIQSGETILLLAQEEAKTKAQYSNFTFWITAEEMNNNLAPE